MFRCLCGQLRELPQIERAANAGCETVMPGCLLWATDPSERAILCTLFRTGESDGLGDEWAEDCEEDLPEENPVGENSLVVVLLVIPL